MRLCFLRLVRILEFEVFKELTPLLTRDKCKVCCNSNKGCLINDYQIISLVLQLWRNIWAPPIGPFLKKEKKMEFNLFFFSTC